MPNRGSSRPTACAREPLAARWGVFHPHQPTVFMRRALYEKLGGLNQELHLVMDTELFYRSLDVGRDGATCRPMWRRSGGTGNPRAWAHPINGPPSSTFSIAIIRSIIPGTLKHYLGRGLTRAGDS